MTEKKATSKTKQRKPGSWARAEELPPPIPAGATLALAGEILGLANRITTGWDGYKAVLRSVDSPFPDTFEAGDHDGFAVAALLHEIADAVGGLGSWAGVRRAYVGMTGETRGTQERQAVAVERCDWAVKEWRAFDSSRRRRRAESRNEHAERLAELRRLEDRIVRALHAALVEQHLNFRRLRPARIRDVLGGLRTNAGGAALLVELASLAAVWVGLTRNAATKALADQRKIWKSDDR